jgi:RNA polymerase-interacting CarD/CdnL/TRCF family regulator
MENSQDYIGKYIISGSLGIGRIIEITNMGDRGDFFKVSFDKSDGTNFFTVNGQTNYRFLASKQSVEGAIEVFNQEPEKLEFASSQEKINFFKKSLKNSNIKDLAKYLNFLNKEDEVHTSLKKQFELTLDSFVKEIEFVLEIKNVDAWRLLNLNKNNKK